LIFSFTLAVALAGQFPPVLPSFKDVTARAGFNAFINRQGSPKKDYIVESVGGGAAWADLDNDGWIDAILVSGETVAAVFRNRRDGTFEPLPLAAKGMGMGVTVADYNNDGWQDFFVTGYGRSWLFRNRQGKGFDETAEGAGVASLGLLSAGAAFFDFDGDGRLDLFVARYVTFDRNKPVRRSADCQYQGKGVFCGPEGFQSDPHSLYRNLGGGSFRDVSVESGIRAAKGPHHGMAVLPLDYNSDGLGDIYVANDDTPNQLWHNMGGGKFRDVAVEAGVAYSPDGLNQSSMGVDAGDLFNRGIQDVFVTTFSGQPFPLYKGGKDGLFEDITWSSGIGRATIPALGWGAHFLDIDHDGWLDVFMVNGHVYPEMGSDYRQRPLAFRNLRVGRFEPWPLFPAALPARGSALGDYDNDGDLDILINNIDAAPVLYQREGKPAANWVMIDAPPGARITLRAGELTQFREIRSASGYLSTSDRRAHFGLGPVSLIDEIRIMYPSGRERALRAVKPNQHLLSGESP
jgi:hypothetical protein